MTNAITHLLHLCDPALPIGGFSHSAGLETYVQKNLVNNAETAREFICQMLTQSLHYTDAALLSLAYNAAVEADIKTILQLDERCNAIKLAGEIREAGKKLGIRLLKIFQPLLQNHFVSQYAANVFSRTTPGHYCIGFGIISYALGIDKQTALEGFYYNAAAGMVTNCVKLIPLSQQQGQQILFELHQTIAQLAPFNMVPDEGMIGSCNAGFDIRSMQHEKLYTRLYMS